MTVPKHGRGNRNPSYKAMGKEQAIYAGAMTRFADVLKASRQPAADQGRGGRAERPIRRGLHRLAP